MYQQRNLILKTNLVFTTTKVTTVSKGLQLVHIPQSILGKKRNLDTSSPETSINLSRIDNSDKKGSMRSTTHLLAYQSISFSSKNFDSCETIYTGRERLFTRTNQLVRMTV